MDDNKKYSSGYYAVIPARILSTPELSPTAKLVYGLISARLGEDGYCWASNEALASALLTSERTITRSIGELIDAGEVIAMHVGAAERHGNHERRLFTRESKTGVDKNGVTADSLDKNGEASLDKNGEDYIDYKYSPNNPLEPPSGGTRVPEPAKWKPERFEAFWAYYRKHVNPANRSAARRAWDKLKPDDELIRQIGVALKARLATDAEWSRGIGLPHASTYLNGRAWEDDWKIKEPSAGESDAPKEGFFEWH